MSINDEDIRLGRRVDFSGAIPPERAPLRGRWTRLAPIDPAAHGDDLWHGASLPGAAATWDYLPQGPFSPRAAFDAWLDGLAASSDPLFFALIDTQDDRAKGVASFMRMNPPHGVIEIGHIWMSPALQRTRASTDSIFTMMEHAFDTLGNRRLEWKCNALNAASRRAAERFGFAFEGIHRQLLVVKGRSRDTAWYSILDGEWAPIARAFRAWLEPGNFDSDGLQRAPLGTFMARERS